MSNDFLKNTGEAHGKTSDPLEVHNETQKAVEDDAYEWYLDEHVRGKKKDSYVAHYERAFDEWKAFMAENHPDRHPTLANKYHIQEWIDELSERMNGDNVRAKLRLVSDVYHQLQLESEAPHPEGYDPFELAKSKKSEKLESDDPDDFPPLDLDDVRRTVSNIKHIQELAPTVFQLKTGVRSSELANVRFEEVHITNPDVLAHFDGEGQDHGQMGSHDQLKGRPNAVYIPPEQVRSENKRVRPTVIPLDREMQRILIDWLLVRPDNGSPYVFLTKKGKQLTPSSLQHFWRDNWEEFRFEDEDSEYRSVVPHWCRHWMSSWFRTEVHMPEPWVQYLRGDKQGSEQLDTSRTAMHRYIHTFYEQVEDEYRDEVFRLGL
jgi:integrase/recombinase XerD